MGGETFEFAETPTVGAGTGLVFLGENSANEFVGGDGVIGERVKGSGYFLGIFGGKRSKLGWWQLKDISPSLSNLFKDIDGVSEGNIVGFEALEFSGMFVFEVRVAFVFVVSKVVFP